MTFPYTRGVPNPPNNPSVDVPNMLTNTNTIDDWVNIDHVGFNTSTGGQHTKVTLVDTIIPPVQTDPQSIVYTTPGTATADADLAFRNENGIFPLSKLRAIGVFLGRNSAGGIGVFSGFNIASINAASSLIYTITLSPNTTTGNSVIVLATAANEKLPSWSFAANVLTLTFSSSVANQNICFSLYQI